MNVGADAVVVLDELDELEVLDDEPVVALPVVTTCCCSAQPAHIAATAAAIGISPRARTASVCRGARRAGAGSQSWKLPAYSANTPPSGSAATAISPIPSIIIGGASTVPPSSVTFAAVATMSAVPR